MTTEPLFSYSETVTGIPLSQLTAAITRTVNSHSELSGVWVMAELSDVRISGGHCYMELIEKNDRGQTIAKLRATIWQSVFNTLRRKFFQATERDIATGLKVLVKGNTNHHSLYGLAFNITDIDPSYTLGDIERLRKEIIAKLASEGVLNLNKQRLLDPAPQRIAVISAKGAAGYGDFINQLTSNSEGFVFYPCLFNCVMQGDRISESIREALDFIESTADLWDCVAIIRGGGATTDLNGFDDYELARAVATCGLPIIVGIGHERDRNVLDEIAHTSLKTPTAVAAFFIDRLRQSFDSVLLIADKIRHSSIEKMRGEERRLTSIESLVPQLSLRRISDNQSKLRTITGKLPILMAGKLGRENTLLRGKWEIINSLKQTIFQKNIQKLNNTEQIIKLLDPSNTLKRGYSITRLNGKSIRKAAEISSGTIITSQLYEGELTSETL